MTQGNVFGSGDVTPEFVRGATFTEVPGGYDADEVRTFLDRIASSLEVFGTDTAEQALRMEFKRNADIAQQVLDAGQAAAEQLRRQAADDARRILEDTREATTTLRDTVQRDIETSRTQVEELRGQFIQDLRDLYDRIGASLYRFERAAAEGAIRPISAPGQPPVPADEQPQPAEPPTEGGWGGEHEAGTTPAPNDVALGDPLPEGSMPPAWTQLPSDAWGSEPMTMQPPDHPVPGEDAGTGTGTGPEPGDLGTPAIEQPVEDEPLAEGEPLVDLRGFHEQVEHADVVAPGGEADHGEFGLGGSDEGGADSAGSWLDMPAGEQVGDGAASDPPAAPRSPSSEAVTLDPSADDALAEQLLAAQAAPLGDTPPAATPPGDAPAAEPAPPPDPSLAADIGAAHAAHAAPAQAGVTSPDAMAVRQLVLDSLAAGQPRSTVEAYLRDQLGFVEPAAIVDAALTDADGQI